MLSVALSWISGFGKLRHAHTSGLPLASALGCLNPRQKQSAWLLLSGLGASGRKLLAAKSNKKRLVVRCTEISAIITPATRFGTV